MEPKDKHSLLENAQQLWSQALVTAEEEAAKLLGRIQGLAGTSQEELKRQARELTERLTAQRKEAERSVEDAVRRALVRLHVPRREEVQQITARLDALAKRVEGLSN